MNATPPEEPKALPTQIHKDVVLSAERESGGVTLVIVDMQHPFVSACKDPHLVPAVVAQVKLAIERNWGIVLIEVKPWAYGQTVKPIMELLDGKYDRYVACTKEGDDGSAEVLAACKENPKLPGDVFRVTGVLIGACVLSTAWGLTRRRSHALVRVIKEACGTTGDRDAAWAAFKVGPRVVVSAQSIDRPRWWNLSWRLPW
jgi:hypothetical protein